jgi:hypothetical protein
VTNVEETITLKVRDFLDQIPVLDEEVRERMTRVVSRDVKYLIQIAVDDGVKEVLDLVESEGKEITIEVGLFVQDLER